MARTIGKLTALAVERTKRRGYYGDGGGLFLQVSARGSKSWVFRFTDNGKLREMGLGPTHTVTLAHAVGDKVEAAYRRGDLFQKRRQLAEAWARFCTASPPADQVVPTRRPAAE
jgi:hypothetical protein